MKNDNTHALRLHAAIAHVVNTEAADAVAARFPLGKSANVGRKAAWASDVCHYLEEAYDGDTVREIRQICCCSDGASAAKRMRACLKNAGNIREFADLYNRTDKTGVWLEYVDEKHLILCYPECFCSCVKRSPAPAPKSWCLCSAGYAKRLFEQVFDSDVRAELLQSVKTGGAQCRIRVTW